MDDTRRPRGGQMDEGRYRLLVDAITDYAIYMLDPTGRVTSWNPGAQRFKGYAADEIIGEHFSRFYTDEERAAGVPDLALREAAELGRFEREGWRVRKDGGRFWAHVVIDPIRSPSGELLGYAKVTRDLTERKLAEEALKRSEEQFRLLVQGVTDYAIYMLDPQGRVISWNPGAERIKGYRPDEIIGQHFSRFYTDDEREAGTPGRGLEIAARVGRWEHEGWRVRKDGTRFWAHVIIDSIRDEGGEVIGFAKITRDVTERLESQRALDAAREALFQSQKLDALGQLTGGVAHDFNNLLMAVLGSLELLRKRLPPDPTIRGLLDNAIQGAERGAALTQRMLAFARHQELKLSAVDLPGLVAGLTGLLQRAIGPYVIIESRFPPELPCVRSDPNQLETALLNLAVNARDAMPGGGRITISAEVRQVRADPALQPGEYVRFAVVDTGEGMDSETISRAAEPFFTTKEVGKGTGLGLSMVHGLAEQSGGRLIIDSRKGEGTTVAIWLPATGAGEPAQDAEAASDSDALDHGRSLDILAVDDDELVLTNTAALLEDIGHRVVRASSASEALDLLERHPEVELVITDHAMPGRTGLQLREDILQLRPGLPVVIATGYAELPSQAAAGLMRIDKPFTQRALSDAVCRAVRSVTAQSS